MNTIVLRGTPREESFITAAIVTPGELVEITSSGTVQAHSTAGGTALKLFVRAQHENDGAGIDDDIASGDEATVVFARSGDKINAIAGESISVGDIVESDGSGHMQTQDSDSLTTQAERSSVVGQALTAAGTSGERVEIIVA